MQLFLHGVGGRQGPEEKLYRYVINQNGSCDNEYLILVSA